MTLPAGNSSEYRGALTGETVPVWNGQITVTVKGNSGEIWLPTELPVEIPVELDMAVDTSDAEKVIDEIPADEEAKAAKEDMTESEVETDEKSFETIAVTEPPKAPKSYKEMSIEELQEAILERMRRNGPITEQMRKDVRENVYHNSLLNWIRSFH